MSIFYTNKNDEFRQKWLKNTLSALPDGLKLLDAGAGELRNKQYCGHLQYISQDFGQYTGEENAPVEGLQNKTWDTTKIDIRSDIANIPQPDSSFDAVVCTEVLEHVPEPTKALEEFTRLLKPGGKLILTAPFASLVHMAPYHYYSGFSKYWYEYLLELRGYKIVELTPNDDWFSFFEQELMRLGSTARNYKDWSWPIAYLLGIIVVLYYKIRGGRKARDLDCFGWHCVA